MAELACPDCCAPMVQRVARRGLGAGKPFYGCSRWPECNATHGAHPDGRPLGIPGDKATKAARVRAHAAFDLIWQSRLMSRAGAYSWMRRRLGMNEDEAHIGRFDVAACERLLALLSALRLDDPEVTAARLELQRKLVESFGPWEPCWRGWRVAAEILGLEAPIYLIELSAAQCATVMDALRMTSHARHDESSPGIAGPI